MACTDNCKALVWTKDITTFRKLQKRRSEITVGVVASPEMKTKKLTRSSSSHGGGKKYRTIKMAHIVGVLVGPESSTFKNLAFKTPALFKSLKAHQCVSVVTPNDTLDLYFPHKDDMMLFVVAAQEMMSCVMFKWTRGALLAAIAFSRLKEGIYPNFAYSSVVTPERTQKKFKQALIKRIVRTVKKTVHEGGRQRRSVFFGAALDPRMKRRMQNHVRASLQGSNNTTTSS
jgi:hypothetical protein